MKRRALLGGAGVCLTLPFLETFAPQQALGQAGAAPKRFAGFFIPNGMDMDYWRPTGSGTEFELSPTMGPQRTFDDGLGDYPADEDGPGLENFKDYLLIISGLNNTQQEEGPGDHAGGIGSMLTNRTVLKEPGLGMGGPSIDFTIAQAIGQDTRHPNLVMAGKRGPGSGGTCDSYPCSTGAFVTFDNEGQNLPRIGEPQQIFDALFEGYDPSASSEELAAIRALDRSILDTVHTQATALQPKLASQDRARLDKFMTSVREVERRIESLGDVQCTVPERIEGDFGNNKESMDVANELLVLAFQCDLTRSASFMWGFPADGRNYASIGATGGHHDISHHSKAEANINMLRRINYWYYRRLSRLASMLQELPDLDGRSMLDNTLIFQSCDISDGDRHNHTDMPVVLLGGGAGFTMGRHMAFSRDDDMWFGHLFTSIGQAFGADISSFGEHGTGPLPDLIV